MGVAYSQTLLEVKSPQYAYVLVILSGGAAFVVSLFSDFVVASLCYVLLAALFASVWPGRALQWAVWLCMPVLVLICFDLLTTFSVVALWRNGVAFAKVFPTACFGAYLGSKLSVRRIAHRSPPSRPKRRGAQVNVGGEWHRATLKEAQSNTLSVSSRRGLAVEKAARDTDLNATLLRATEDGDLERIKLLVAQGADVNALSDERWTPLMIASLGQDAQVVRTLFGSGASPDAACGKGWTALMLATLEGRAEVVRALLEHGPKVDAKNSAGWTALRFAVAMDETEILRLLLDAGADANLPDNEGRTPLMQAAGENLLECLKALLMAGADPLLKDSTGRTALMIARAHGHAESIRLLKEAEAKASSFVHAPPDDLSYFYQLKEELEDGLRSHPESPSQSSDLVARLLSVIQTVQDHIDAERKERALLPSEISHKLALTLKEAAALSGLPRQHLLEAIEERRLKAQRVKDGWRIRRTDLDDYMRRLA